jgi:hypothetical protein
MNNQQAAHIDPVTINGITLTEGDLNCIARKAQEYMRITHFNEPVEEVFFSTCRTCPHNKGAECHHIDAIEKVAKLTGVQISLWGDKHGRMMGTKN